MMRSVRDRRLVAAITPAPTPNTSHRMPLPKASDAVTGKSRATMVFTDSCVINDSPRSPRASRPRKCEVLEVHRLIETQPGANHLHRFLARLPPRNEAGDVVRHREVDDEHAGCHDPDDERAPREAPEQEADHDASSPAAGAAWSRRGSSASRTPSPSTLNATVVTSSAAPGKNTNHHATL